MLESYKGKKFLLTKKRTIHFSQNSFGQGLSIVRTILGGHSSQSQSTNKSSEKFREQFPYFDLRDPTQTGELRTKIRTRRNAGPNTHDFELYRRGLPTTFCSLLFFSSEFM